VSRADILAAKDICGPNLGSLKGKTERHKSDHVQSLYQQGAQRRDAMFRYHVREQDLVPVDGV
jgi:hypothetical protein